MEHIALSLAFHVSLSLLPPWFSSLLICDILVELGHSFSLGKRSFCCGAMLFCSAFRVLCHDSYSSFEKVYNVVIYLYMPILCVPEVSRETYITILRNLSE